MNKKIEEVDYDKPVAYDADGHPLYAHPPASSKVPPVVQVVRQVTPSKPYISDDIKSRHVQSERMYPNLNLSDGEFVISVVKRHQIGLFFHYVIGISLISFAIYLMLNHTIIVNFLQLGGIDAVAYLINASLVLFILFVLMMLYANYYIYNNNRFFLTNESIIQEGQIGLFSRNVQTISLGNIEDASYTQNGILSQLFDFGSIRLSTEGDETTYRFSYVTNPKKYLDVMNDAIEAFKNGRPVDPYES